MSIDEELVSFDPGTLEGVASILAALEEIRPQFESKSTWALANRRVESLARAAGMPAALLAAKVFVEALHPRGPDGRFIEAFAWVRWFDFDRRKWFSGKVAEVDEVTGEVTVHRRLDSEHTGIYRFNMAQASKQLYTSPKPKATLDFPDVTRDGDSEGWKQVGGQGGSNPGGTYELDDNNGMQYHEWSEDELDFLLHGRPSVEVVGLVDTKDQLDDEDYSDRLKEKLAENYPAGGEAGVWEQIPGGRQSAGGVIVWDDPDEGTQLAVVNRDNEQEQRPTPEGKWRADFALQNWMFRRIKAKLLPQNPERKLHPSWRRVVYGIGPDVGGVGGLDSGVPRLPHLPSLGKETAEGIKQSASQAIQTESEIRNAATGALVSLEDIIRADPMAKLFPFEADADVLGNGDRLRALINAFVQPSVRPGDRFYIKDLSGNMTGPDRVANEIMATRLYELTGVPVPDVFQGSDPAKIGSRIIGGELTSIEEYLDDPEVMERVRQGFTVDAWLANWDVAGLEFDNIVVDEDGIPYRIDAGGALAYRAMGSPKGDMFTSEVGELITLSPDNPRATSSKAPIVFAGLTDEEKIEGAMRVAGISPEQIRDLGLETGIDQNTVDTLLARRTYIIDHLLDGVDPFAGESEEIVPELSEIIPDIEEPAVDLGGEPKADLDIIDMVRNQEPDQDTFDNPVFEKPAPGSSTTAPGVQPAPAAPESMQPAEFEPAVTWADAWSWSGESQQWVTSPNAQGPPTREELEQRWLDRVDEVNGYIDSIEPDGAVSANLPARDLAGSGALDNPRGLVLVLDTGSRNAGGRTDMFVPWGTDAEGNKVLVSRISGQTVTPALDWTDSQVATRSVDLSRLEDDFEDELDWIDGLTTKAAEAQVSLEAMSNYRDLAEGRHLGWLKMEDLGDDPADLFILDAAQPVTLAGAPDGGLQVLDAQTGRSLFFVPADQLADPELGPQDLFRGMSIKDSDGLDHELVLPDMTGQQVMRAKLSMGLLEERSSQVNSAEVTAGFPEETWVKPDPELDAPDVSASIRGSKPVPTGRLAGPALPDDWDYQAELEPGTYVDTSQPMVLDPAELESTHPGLPQMVPIIDSINFEAATDALGGQWVMHDVQDYRFTRQPVLVNEVIRSDDGLEGIAVTYPNGKRGVLTGPPQSRLHIVEPPKEGSNIPAYDYELVLGHNGDIRLGKEVIGSWWHADRNLSHRHTYGYMVDSPYTAHGKSVIGFRSKARDVRKQVRSEVFFADNYEDIEPEWIQKGPAVKTLETNLKAEVPGTLTNGQPWSAGQAVNRSWVWNQADAQGVIVGGVHPSRPDLVYFRDHNTGHITLENASDFIAHGDPIVESDELEGGLFQMDGEQWYVQQVLGNEVVAYAVADGTLWTYKLDEIPQVEKGSPWAPVSTHEGAYLAGSLSSQEARDEWTAMGGELLADGEVPLPGTQVVDGFGDGWRVLRIEPEAIVVARDQEIQKQPARVFRLDRAHHGGELGALGQIEMGTEQGGAVGYEFSRGDILYTSPGRYRVLTPTGELYTFDVEDGWPDQVYDTDQHGDVIQTLLGDPATHRVGVYMPDSNTAAFLEPVGGEIHSSSLVGSLEDAKAGSLLKDGSSRVVSYGPAGINPLVDPAAELEDAGVDIGLPEGAGLTGTYTPGLVVDPHDLEWFPNPAGRANAPVAEAGTPPVITGAGMPAGVSAGKTFPMSENSKSLEEAVQSVLDGLAEGDWDGKTVHMVQFDKDAVEDFVIQVMPVQDRNTGQKYVEVFFRPLEGHAGQLFDSLVAPPLSSTEGEWMVPGENDPDADLPPTELAVGDIIAVRRGPNGLLKGWNTEGEFGTARVISEARLVGEDTYEFDVMLPNGKAVTVSQDNPFNYFLKAEWAVQTDSGKWVKPSVKQPTRLNEAAVAAGWTLPLPFIGSQVEHNTSNLENGMKVIDTKASFPANDPDSRDFDTAGTGGVFQRTLGDGTKIWMSLVKDKPATEEINNFSRQIYIQVPWNEDAPRDAEDMAQAISGGLEAVGLSQDRQVLPDQASLEEWALNTIGQHFGFNEEFARQNAAGPKVKQGPLTPGKKWDRAQVEELLETEVSPRVGRPVTLADFEFVVDPDGRLMVASSQNLAEAISSQTGYLSHRHESDIDYYSQDEGVARISGRLARVLGGGKTPGNTGPAGRAAMGIWSGGQSSDLDMYNGAGNRYYFWTHDTDPPQLMKRRGYDLLIDDEIFQRLLGNGVSSRDNYGRRTTTDGVKGYPWLSWTKTAKSDHNESTVKYGIDAALIEALTVPDELHPGIINELKAQGLDQVGGRPVEDIVRPYSEAISMKRRRKQRRNRPNGGFFPPVGNVAQVLSGQELEAKYAESELIQPAAPAEAPELEVVAEPAEALV